MQSLLVILAALTASTAFANPITFHEDNTPTASRTFALNFGDFIKIVLGDKSIGLELNFPLPVVVADDVVSLLSKLDLDEAALIASRVNLRNIILNSGFNDITLFAPSDEAVFAWRESFPDAAADLNTLTQLCKSWIVPAIYMSTDIADEMTVEAMSGAILRFNIYGQVQKMTVNGAPIINEDFAATNGVIHVLDKVVFPIPDGTVYHTLSKVEDFSKLIELVHLAGLQDILTTRDALTVFAPTNDAFALLPATLMDKLTANVTLLQEVLKYHTLIRTQYSAGLYDAEEIMTLLGRPLAFNINNGKVTLNRQMNLPVPTLVIHADIPATNGVIHVIDHVLTLPQSHAMVVV